MSMWTPEQQAIIDRINSGQTDFTFGPGSPNPTHEDLHTYVGGKFSPAGGFAVDGGVALAPKEYNMFTPEQRRSLGIMDIAPKDQVGKIERYYGSEGMGSSQFASNNASPTVPSPVSGGTYAFGTGSNPSQMSTGMDYAAAKASGNAVASAGAGIGNALSQLGQSQARAGQVGMSQAMAMLQQRKNSALAALLPPISSYG